MTLARLVTCALVVALSWFALQPGPAWARKRGGTLVMLVQPEPPTLASYISTSGPIGQDGKPFTSADVTFSVLEVLKKFHPRGPVTFRDVADIETPDEHTAVFKLANPAPYLMMALSGYESPMLPKHLYASFDRVSLDK